MSIRRPGRKELCIDLDSCPPASTEADTGTAISEISTPTHKTVQSQSSCSPRSVLETLADTEELRASRRDLERRIQICDTLLDLRNYEQHLMMEYFSSLLCTTPTEETAERDDKIVRVDLTSRTDYAAYNETQAVDEETVVIASQAPPLAGPRGSERQPARPLIRRPHLDGGAPPSYNDPESEALIARAQDTGRKSILTRLIVHRCHPTH